MKERVRARAGLSDARIRDLRHTFASPTGRAFNAIRNSEAAAQTLSVPLARIKLIAFVVAGFYAGIGGGLFASLAGLIDPLEFGVSTSIRHVVFIVFGGIGSIAGSVVGAAVLTVLPEMLRGFKEYNEFVYGGLLLIVLILLPKGLVGLWPELSARLRRRVGLRMYERLRVHGAHLLARQAHAPQDA